MLDVQTISFGTALGCGVLALLFHRRQRLNHVTTQGTDFSIELIVEDHEMKEYVVQSAARNWNVSLLGSIKMLRFNGVTPGHLPLVRFSIGSGSNIPCTTEMDRTGTALCISPVLSPQQKSKRKIFVEVVGEDSRVLTYTISVGSYYT